MVAFWPFFLACFVAVASAGMNDMMNTLREVCPMSGPPPLAVLIMQYFFANNVTVDRADYLGRPALKVAFTDAFQKYNRDPQAVAQANAYVTIPLTNFYEGTIEVDIAAERNSYADEGSRAFAGVAFRSQPDPNKATFELVYLRMTNGLLNNPPPQGERAVRAVQYASPPKWDFDTLRQQFPGKYEAGAKIAEKRWNHLRLIVKNNNVQVFIDYDPNPVLNAALLGTSAPGPVAFWVGDATTAYFSNFQMY